MAGRVRFSRPDADSDVEGHASAAEGREVEISELRMTTADGDELKLQPEEDGERWKVTEGPEDLIGHASRVRF